MANEKILVVDDEEAIREVISTLLDAQGFECTTSSNGKLGLEAFRQDTFDLVLSDIVMPEMDGLKLLSELRLDDPDVPVIMVTAMHDISIALEAIRAGAYDYILKPFEKDQLYLSVRRALEHRSLVLENRTYQSDLEQLVAERTQQLSIALQDLEQSYDYTLEALGGAGHGCRKGPSAAYRPRRFPARYRQDGRPRQHTDKARAIDRGRTRNHAPALRHRICRARKNSVSEGSRRNRIVAPGVLRRFRISARTQGTTDSSRSENIRRGRYARCDDL
jgi:CheY-like chemotaxis protein